MKQNELFYRMSEGDEKAFTEIFRYYAQRIYHYILHKTKSPQIAEEIVQEVFTKVWHSREKFSDVNNGEAFLFSMASNKLVDFLRKMAVQEKLKKQVWKSITDIGINNDTIEQIDYKQSHELVSKAVNQLSPQRRKIFLMNKEQGFSRKEIADKLNLSVNTVNNHLNEAVKFVRCYLEATPEVSLVTLLFIMRVLV